MKIGGLIRATTAALFPSMVVGTWSAPYSCPTTYAYNATLTAWTRLGHAQIYRSFTQSSRVALRRFSRRRGLPKFYWARFHDGNRFSNGWIRQFKRRSNDNRDTGDARGNACYSPYIPVSLCHLRSYPSHD